MSDKYNNNNKHDDINEFFSQFDQATIDQNRRSHNDENYTDSRRSRRSQSTRSGGRSSRSANVKQDSTASRSQKKSQIQLKATMVIQRNFPKKNHL